MITRNSFSFLFGTISPLQKNPENTAQNNAKESTFNVLAPEIYCLPPIICKIFSLKKSNPITNGTTNRNKYLISLFENSLYFSI